MDGKQFRVRTRLIALVLTIILCIFLYTLYQLQMVNGTYYMEQTTRKIVTIETVEAARGEVLDRYGRVLIGNRSTYQVTLDASLMGTTEERNANLLELVEVCSIQAQSWADTLPISATAPFSFTEENPFTYTITGEDGSETVYDTNFSKLLSSLSSSTLKNLDRDPTATEVVDVLRTFFDIDPSFSDQEARSVVGVLYEQRLRSNDIVRTTYIFADDVDIEFITSVKERNLTGVRIDTATTRDYGTTYAAHLLGRVGAIWSDEWSTYQALGYSMDEMVGKDGVEQAFEPYLRGESGTRIVELSTTGKVVDESWDTDPVTGESLEPQPGDNVSLTLDIKLQEVVERALAEHIPNLLSDQTEGGAAVVMDMTGGVLALASYPTFDLATLYSDGNTYQELLADPLNPLRNRATHELYSPGSTFKMIVAIGALQEEIITTRTEILCSGRYTYYERIEDQPMCWIYRQYGGTHGGETVTDAIRDSCNIFFYDTGRRLGISTMNVYADMFGLGTSTGIETGDVAGVLASPEYTESVGQTWYEGNTMYAAIGQENTRTTPIQLANYIATLVNGGDHYEAHLLKTVKSNDFGEVVEEYVAEPIDTINIEQEYLDAVLEGMYQLANEGSVATYFADLSVEVGAKTGTAQVASDLEADAVFVCFAPYDDPEVAIAIVVERGGSGSEIAGIAADILAYYFSAEETIESIGTENTLLQ